MTVIILLIGIALFLIWLASEILVAVCAGVKLLFRFLREL